MNKILTIAGSDPSGGAGIQADIKTITVHKMYAMSVITALTAQNTTGVYGINEIKPEFVEKQLDCIFQDIVPDAVKIGMAVNADIIAAISQKLIKYKAQNIVVDPVMISTSGNRLLQDRAVSALVKQLLPIASLITPNIPEAQVLSGLSISSFSHIKQAAEAIFYTIHNPVLIKGGHLTESADDFLYTGTDFYVIPGERIYNPNTHGTGCTLSSAIACNLAEGNSLLESVKRAKKYLAGALRSNLNLGHGSGPLNHMYL